MISILKYKDRDSRPELISINECDLRKEEDIFFFGEERDSEYHIRTASSPWMNRINLGDSYILVPSNIYHNHDIEVATDFKFIVVKYDDMGLTKIVDSDIDSVNNAIQKALSPTEKAKYKNMMAEITRYGIIFQAYRKIYDYVSDEVAEQLRDALQNDIPKCERWANEMHHLNSLLDQMDTGEVSKEDVGNYVISTGDYILLGLVPSESIAECMSDEYGINLTLANTLADPKKIEQLIRALDPETRAIFRSFSDNLYKQSK